MAKQAFLRFKTKIDIIEDTSMMKKTPMRLKKLRPTKRAATKRNEGFEL